MQPTDSCRSSRPTRSGGRASVPGSAVPWSRETSAGCARTSSSAFALPSRSGWTSATSSSPCFRRTMPATMKDVDGLHPFSVGQLYLGHQTLVPATPLGVMHLLTEYRISIAGTRAVVVGRSPLVGKPMAMLLLQANATVTICHSRTEDLARHTLDADLLVAAVGVPGVITADMVKQGATVVDVGITRTDAGLVGDVDQNVAEVAAFLTPVPGGVGPMTIAALLGNAVRAARYRSGKLAFPRI